VTGVEIYRRIQRLAGELLALQGAICALNRKSSFKFADREEVVMLHSGALECEDLRNSLHKFESHCAAHTDIVTRSLYETYAKVKAELISSLK